MKKISLLSLLFIPLLITSCGTIKIPTVPGDPIINTVPGDNHDNLPEVEPDIPEGGITGTREELFESVEVINMASRGEASVDAYYEPVRGLKGAALKDKLFDICQPQETFSYNHLKESFPITDYNPDNPSCMTLFYTGEQYSISSFKRAGWSYINREHVWPNSKGTGESGPGSDKHMQRPCEQKINSTRGNSDYGYVHGGKSLTGINEGNKTGGGLFEPKDEFKGDAARIIFYLAAVYNRLELARPRDTSRYNYFTAGNYHGKFEDLYRWATDPTIDPVSKLEMNRNNQVDILYQHNRNPFIDHPEFVEMIYDKNYDGPGALN